jgi:hypothetical protein
MDVGDVELEHRPREHLERVQDRDRPEGEPGRIDDQPGAAVDRLVDPLDQLVLGVRLPELDRVLAGGRPAHRFHLGQGRRAVDLGLPGAEPVEVRAIEHVDRLGHLLLLEAPM